MTNELIFVAADVAKESWPVSLVSGLVGAVGALGLQILYEEFLRPSRIRDGIKCVILNPDWEAGDDKPPLKVRVSNHGQFPAKGTRIYLSLFGWTSDQDLAIPWFQEKFEIILCPGETRVVELTHIRGWVNTVFGNPEASPSRVSIPGRSGGTIKIVSESFPAKTWEISAITGKGTIRFDLVRRSDDY